MTIESGPARYRHRGSGSPVTATAMRVDAGNLQAAAGFCGGTTWASSVVVPRDGGEDVASHGDWIIHVGKGRYHVATDAEFRKWFEVAK